MKSYLATAHDVYKEAALNPQKGLCCTTTPVWKLPGLTIPEKMLEMNYGCGSTVNPRDLADNPTVLYVGVGGGMELLQFAYFSRGPGSVIGVDLVDDMIAACRENLDEAGRLNDWFASEYVEIRKGDALALPATDSSVDVAAQNCLFNIFHSDELDEALREIHRVLKPHGRLILSDPIAEEIIPESLRSDERLRAECLTGALPLADYLARLTSVGFGTIEVRARRPYRVLDPRHYGTDRPLLIESVEICAIKDPIPADGPCIFTGRTAIYFGDGMFDDGNGHMMAFNQPLAVCDKTAAALEKLGREDLLITGSTYFYDGGGCC
ncbi:MAG: arsenosugar biosynthesis arsenite methyltransferase ArsM [Candidatus Kapaibacterium sp.]